MDPRQERKENRALIIMAGVVFIAFLVTLFVSYGVKGVEQQPPPKPAPPPKYPDCWIDVHPGGDINVHGCKDITGYEVTHEGRRLVVTGVKHVFYKGVQP